MYPSLYPWTSKAKTEGGDSCYWDISGGTLFPRKLFREIVKAEIDFTGMEDLVSNVYFLNSKKNILFHLYNDRGVDVVTLDKETLRPLYESCNE